MFKNLLKVFGRESSRVSETINILTRTSGRPKGFKKCHRSIKEQSLPSFNHIVSYENSADLQYLYEYEIQKIRVEKSKRSSVEDCQKKFEPYNLYCNELLKEVEEGWIMFLDDDDMLAHSQVLALLQKNIKRYNEDTLFIWKTQFPDGSLLPPSHTFKDQQIQLQHIDTACFMFHSKYKDVAKWDQWWAADFRFVRDLSEYIPKQKWIDEVLTLKNNFGDRGRKNDLET